MNVVVPVHPSRKRSASSGCASQSLRNLSSAVMLCFCTSSTLNGRALVQQSLMRNALPVRQDTPQVIRVVAKSPRMGHAFLSSSGSNRNFLFSKSKSIFSPKWFFCGRNVVYLTTRPKLCQERRFAFQLFKIANRPRWERYCIKN